MKKIGLIVFSLVLGMFIFQSCEDQDDTAVPVNDFIWKGLNAYYLWQQNVPDLADSRFANQGELNNYLKSYGSPEQLFNHLIYKTDASGNEIDRWSRIFPDFTVLENALQGISKSNGAEFGLFYADESQTTVIGYVRYILPGTDAANKNIHRGDVFYAVNGNILTADNYSQLLNQDTYTLNMATVNSDGSVTPNDIDVFLIKSQYSEDPVYIADTYTTGSHTIGYLMYNGFYSDYDAELNAAFSEFASAGVTDLVLDLRYNGGGSIRTATYLASMITGQFNGQLFAKQQWNSKLQGIYESNNPSALTNLFSNTLSDGSSINSLNLSKVYIITTGSTASASELVINCLKPYIDVVQIGTTTIGKNVGSITMYDSPDFTSKNRNGSHRYAMQPIVLKILNKNNFGEYSSGITPTYEVHENLSSMGTLGDPTEPLYSYAIDKITNGGKPAHINDFKPHKIFKDSRNLKLLGNEMYLENELPSAN